jgi:hypothetical protein
MGLLIHFKKNTASGSGMVMRPYNLSYSGGRDRRIKVWFKGLPDK